jgi:glucosyl-3-phosphoglycerate phosphatase
MTSLIIWRHGRTAWNESGRVQGHADIDLDEVGVAQAADAAARVAGSAPTLIISSDLRRATSTAAPLAELTGLPVALDPRLRERYFGPWQGLLGAEIKQRYPEDFARWAHEAIGAPEIETVEDMAKRVSAAVHDALDQMDGGTAVLVTHGGTARVACGSLLGWSPEAWRTLSGLYNCHRSVLVDSTTRGWQLAAHNLP